MAVARGMPKGHEPSRDARPQALTQKLAPG
jgi:hypothetical protein